MAFNSDNRVTGCIIFIPAIWIDLQRVFTKRLVLYNVIAEMTRALILVQGREGQ